MAGIDVGPGVAREQVSGAEMTRDLLGTLPDRVQIAHCWILAANGRNKSSECCPEKLSALGANA